MPGTLPHTQNGLGQAAAEQHVGEQADEETASDPTTPKVEGKVAVDAEDSGGDPYNRTGRFERLVR